MDYNYNEYGNQYHMGSQPPAPGVKGFAIASLVCGICSIVFCCSGFFSAILGALGLLFALLPYKRGEQKHPMSIAGFILGWIGIVLGILSCINSLSTYMRMIDDYAQIPEYYEGGNFGDFYGQDLSGLQERFDDIIK